MSEDAIIFAGCISAGSYTATCEESYLVTKTKRRPGQEDRYPQDEVQRALVECWLTQLLRFGGRFYFYFTLLFLPLVCDDLLQKTEGPHGQLQDGSSLTAFVWAAFFFPADSFFPVLYCNLALFLFHILFSLSHVEVVRTQGKGCPHGSNHPPSHRDCCFRCLSQPGCRYRIVRWLGGQRQTDCALDSHTYAF